jgi:ketosteroid isomerase-like protein
MKTSLILCAFLAGSGFAQVPAAAPSPIEDNCKDIDKVAMQIAEDWKDGYNSGNAAQVAALYAEDAYYLTQHFVTGLVKGRTNIRAYVQRGVDAKYHVDSIEILTTDCSGDMAYSIDRYESTNAGQKAFGVNVVVIKKFADGWRIVAHESAVPDAATAIQKLTPESQ